MYFHPFPSRQDKPKVFVARNGKQLAPQPDDHSVQKFLSFAVCEKLGIENRQAYSASAVGSVKQEEEVCGYLEKSGGDGFDGRVNRVLSHRPEVRRPRWI